MSRVCGCPGFVDGIAVKVLAVDGNSALFNNGRHSVHKPVKGLLVPKVKLEGVALDTVGNLISRLAVADKPLGLDAVFGVGGFGILLGGYGNAFRLEPEQRFNAVFVGIVAYVLKLGGETLGVGHPVSDRESALIFVDLGIPIGVHPPNLNIHIVFEIFSYGVDLILVGRLGHFVIDRRGNARNKGLGKIFPVVFIHIAVHKPVSPKVCGTVGVAAVIENYGGQRSSCGLAGF